MYVCMYTCLFTSSMAANLSLKRLLHFIRLLKTTPLLQTSSITTHQNRLLTTTTSTHSQSLTTTHVSVSAPPKSSSSSSFTVKYLTDSCGLPLEKALLASKKFQLHEFKSHKHESVLFLFRSFQFSQTHIKKLLIKCPTILRSNVHNNLKPKLQFLTDCGFLGPLLPELIVANPLILRRSLRNFIKPTFEFLDKYIQTPDKLVAAVKRSSRLITSDLKSIMQPNIHFLLSEGVTASTIEIQIVRQPRTLMMKLDKIVNAVETVKKLGLEPSAPTFLEAIRVMLSVSQTTWERKMQLLKSFGWSEEEIMFAFKRGPNCLAGSEEKIRSLMDFYLNTMKLNPAVIARYPLFLMSALSTRIRPRYNVLKVLESKKLLKENRKPVWLLTVSEKRFLKTVVHKHLDQVPYLMELYRGTITGDDIHIHLH